MLVSRSHALTTLLVGVVTFAILTQAIPAPQSTDLVVVDYSVELARRARPWWTIPTSQMTAYVTAGTCIAGSCGAAINVRVGGVVEILVGIIYGIMAFGNNWAPIDAVRNAGISTPPVRGELLEPGAIAQYDKFIELVDQMGSADNDIDELIAFESGRSNSAIMHTGYGSLVAERKQVIHPIKRDMRSVVRLRTVAPTTYGIEAYHQEESDYGYPPDRGWVGETGDYIGNAVHEYTVESNTPDVCMKLVNYQSATAYAYMKYDGTEDNEEFDSVFGCENEEYPEQ